MKRQLRRLAACERGSVAMLSALLMLVILGSGALAVDVGSFYYQKRRLQSATDLAALAAAGNLANPRKAAIATLELNGFPASTLQAIETGTYVADAGVNPGRRFTPLSSGNVNAVRISTRTTSSYIFGAIFAPRPAHADTRCEPNESTCDLSRGGGSGSVRDGRSVRIEARAIAARNSLASFAIGSRLLAVNGGILNGVLGALLGGSLSLSIMDYQALALARPTRGLAACDAVGPFS